MARLRFALRCSYAPIMLLGVNGLAFTWIADGRPVGALVGLLAAAIVFSFAAERVLPYNDDWNRSHADTGRDTMHAVVNEAANFSTLMLLPIFAHLAPVQGL